LIGEVIIIPTLNARNEPVTTNHIPSLAQQTREWKASVAPEPSNSGRFNEAVNWRDAMKNLYVVAALAATLAGGTLESASAQSASKTGVKNVVLVHGAFADGSGWEAVADILKKDGYAVSVAQPPETSYSEDVKSTKAVIDRQSGPVVLVGHSYGGAIITEAGNDPKVAALVYIAAFALDAGESCAMIEKALPPATTGIKATDDGYFYIDAAVFHADFAADVPKAKAEFMAMSQVLISADSFTSPVRSPAWRSKPTWYMVATADRSISPDQERMMAKRAHAKTIEVNSSHVAYISHPRETAKLIEEAATSAPANQ
jgi:pimeloyl-ACP methyl ester carboxylesterase